MTQQTNRQKWTWVTVASHSAFVCSIPVLVIVKLALTANPWSQSHPEHSNYFQACLIRFHAGKREDRNYAELVRWNLPTQRRWCRSIQLKWLYVVGWNNSLVSTMNDVTEEEEDKETRQVLSNRVMPGQTFKQSRDRRRTEQKRDSGVEGHFSSDWKLFSLTDWLTTLSVLHSRYPSNTAALKTSEIQIQKYENCLSAALHRIQD